MRDRIGPPLVVVVVAALIGFGVFFAGRSAGPDSIQVGETATEPGAVYDPVKAGEELPDGFRQLLPRDAIHPIYDPKFLAAEAAGWPDETLVIGVAKDGEAKAYPVSFLNGREMVIDSIARTPVLVTWCPLCATAMVHRRELEGQELVFGNQGALFGNAMTWWDHDTGSVWSQPLGQAILGSRKGDRLDLMSSSLTEWASWRAAHPETLALDAPGGSAGFSLDRLSIVVDFSSEVVAYPIPDLRRIGVINDVVAGVEIAVVIDPNDEQRWSVMARRLEDQVLTLGIEGSRLVDRETGTVWDPTRSIGLEGELAGETLGLLPGFTSFPSDFRTFWPDGRVWTP